MNLTIQRQKEIEREIVYWMSQEQHAYKALEVAKNNLLLLRVERLKLEGNVR